MLTLKVSSLLILATGNLAKALPPWIPSKPHITVLSLLCIISCPNVIPFTAAQKAKINSEKVNKLVAESSYSVGLQSLNTAYRTAIIEPEKFQKTVEYFEKAALNNSTLISTTAQQQLVNGSINYLEWVTLINQATAIRNDYIEAIKNLNESAIQINYLVNY